MPSAPIPDARSQIAQEMLVVGASLFALVALQPPPTRAGGTQMGRRVALASGAALLAPSKRAAADLGQSGALRSDIGESVSGSGVEILVKDLAYTELKECPKGFFIPPRGGPWDCIEVTATAFNQGKRKEAKAADIFGLIFDDQGFTCAATALDPSIKAPIATLDQPFPKDKEVPIKFTVAVQGRSPRPFRFGGFKGSYRNAATVGTFKTFDPCEIDSSQCAEDEDQPENARISGDGKSYMYNKK